jgi:hypothetical protein
VISEQGVETLFCVKAGKLLGHPSNYGYWKAGVVPFSLC